MHMPKTDVRCYAARLLNPFQGVAQIVETEQARAISVDGLNWRVQIRSEIYKTPWSALAIPAQTDRFFVYGVWSHQDGLARVPIHPSLYLEHVEQAVQDLLVQLAQVSRQVPFVLADTHELWLMDASGKQPVALIGSRLPTDEIPPDKQPNWYATANADTAFTSAAFSVEQAKSTIKCQTQDFLHRIIKQRCRWPYQACWIERLPDGSGSILSNHAGKTQRRNEQLQTVLFPSCLLDEHWPDPQAQQLVTDYLNWQAALLLMLPLPAQRRRELEQQAQQRPLCVHTHYRLYPDVIDKVLLNKILVEAVMRKSVAKNA